MTEPTDDYERILNGTDPIEKLNELALTIHEHYFDVGCLLFFLKENDVYKTVDGSLYYSDKHTKWKQFCEDKLHVSYRTAQYWLNLYRYFTEMGITREQLQELGWSKAKELIDLTDEVEILLEVLEKAQDMTIQELRAYIQQYVKTDAKETTKFTKFSFSLPEAQAEHAEEIMKAAQKACGNGDLNEAFWKIIVEWSQYSALDDFAVTSEVEAESDYLVAPTDDVIKLFN